MDKIVLNDIQNSQWIFHCDSKGRLCYSKNGAPRQILQSDVTAEFDIITDAGGNFHLVLQASDGSLIYLTYDFSNWKKYIILKSKSNRSVMRNFKLLITDSRLHCFYILELNGKSMLVHHILSSSDTSGTPNVISYCDSLKNFCSSTDSDGHIHIFFFDESGKLRYKIHCDDITDDRTLAVEDDIKSISCISDGSIHIIYTAKMKGYYTLIYYNLDAKERRIISFSDSNISDTHIFKRDNNLFVQWRERTRYYQCISADGGGTFKKPTHINETRTKRAESLRIRTERNPMVFNTDTCIALADGDSIDILNAPSVRVSSKTGNHTSSKNGYNVIDGGYSDELKIIQSKIRENEKELIRLNSIINTISEKISNLTKPEITEPKIEINEDNIGEINKENYELFKNTEIENIEFQNQKIFE